MEKEETKDQTIETTCDCRLITCSDHPEAELFRTVLKGKGFPLMDKQIRTVEIALPGIPVYEMRCYIGDPGKLTDEQKEAFATWLIEKFPHVTREELTSDWETTGVPLGLENRYLEVCPACKARYPNTTKPITPDALELLDYIVENPDLSRKQLRQRTGVTLRAVTRNLAVLTTSDYIYFQNRKHGAPRKYHPTTKALDRLPQ